MAVTNAQIRQILTANPNITDEQLAKAMDRYDVSPAQMHTVLRSMGSSVTPSRVQARYESGGGTKFAQATLDQAAGTDALSQFTSVYDVPAEQVTTRGKETPSLLGDYTARFAGNAPSLAEIINAPWIPTLIKVVRNSGGEEAVSDLENWILAIQNQEQTGEGFDKSGGNVAFGRDLNGNIVAIPQTGNQAVDGIIRSVASGDPISLIKSIKDLKGPVEPVTVEELNESFARWAEQNPNIRISVDAPQWNEDLQQSESAAQFGNPTTYTDIGDEILNVPADMIEGTYEDEDGNLWVYDVLGRRGITSRAEPTTVEPDEDLTGGGGQQAADELQREKDVNTVNKWLEDNPAVTKEQVTGLLDSYVEKGKKAYDIFEEATGTTVDQYVSDRSERPWVFKDGVMTNVYTGETVTPGDPSLYTEGEFYSGGGSTDMNPKDPTPTVITDQIILDWYNMKPRTKQDVINEANARGISLERVKELLPEVFEDGDTTGTTTTTTVTGQVQSGDPTGGITGGGLLTETDSTVTGGFEEGGDGGEGEEEVTTGGEGTGTGTGTGSGTGAGSGPGLFGTRTTDSVLGGDLMAIDLAPMDTTIPRLEKLIATPSYAPAQMLLSGISQRYKV